METQVVENTLIHISLLVKKGKKSVHKHYFVFHDYDASSYCSMIPSQVFDGNMRAVEDWQIVTEQDFIFDKKDFFLQKDFEELNLTENEIKELCNQVVEAHNKEYAIRINENE